MIKRFLVGKAEKASNLYEQGYCQSCPPDDYVIYFLYVEP